MVRAIHATSGEPESPSRPVDWPPATPAERLADYRQCLQIAQHYENFPVASRLLPDRYRLHLAAIYAFARGADDLADEPRPRIGGRPVEPRPRARLQALDEWEAGLDGAVPPGAEPVFRALQATRELCEIPVELLRRLITAFRWDVERDRFASWEELRRYADFSAAPVGRLVLCVAGTDSRRFGEASDALCVALQYTNFWQDLSVDWSRGRLYLPESSWTGQSSLDRGELDRRFPRRPVHVDELAPSQRDALVCGLQEAIEHTEGLFRASETLPVEVGASLSFYLAAAWEGGHRILAKTRRLGARAFTTRPRLSFTDRAATIWRAYRRIKASS